MAFLFKSKKSQGTALPPATRNIHTSEGTTSASPSALNANREKDQTPTPSSSVNNSLNSLAAENTARPEQQWQRRERADSEPQVDRTVLDPFILVAVALIHFAGLPRSPTTTSRSSSQCSFVSMVAKETELSNTTIESLSSVWGSSQCGGLKRRRHLSDGWTGEWGHGER